MTVVIVGAGFGGLECAKNLRHAKDSRGGDIKVILVDSSNFHLFQPLLYQVATAGLSPADIACPIRHILRDQKNTDVHLKRVTGVDVVKKQVITEDSRISYDYLVLATGARYSYFGHDDWEKFAPGLKSVSDATKIRRHILLAFEKAELEPDPEKRKGLITFVIVGGGPTGVEMAGAIAELAQRALAKEFRHFDPRSAKIILIEAGDKILASFPDRLAARAAGALKKLGVEVRTGTRVGQIDSKGVGFGDEKILTTNVIWAAGVVASPAGQWLGAKTDHAGRVLVNADLTVTGQPDIFVIGDTAAVVQDGQQLPGVSPVAMQEGRYVARVIAKKLKGETSQFPPFRYFNKGNLATVGRKFAVADLGFIKLSGLLAWVTWLVVHIYYLIGFRNRIVVLIQWGWAYLTFQRGARLIVTAPDSQDSGHIIE